MLLKNVATNRENVAGTLKKVNHEQELQKRIIPLKCREREREIERKKEDKKDNDLRDKRSKL